ncbi:MAG: DUF4384 domain-containing protein [Thermodesulfovibrionales bacterium]
MKALKLLTILLFILFFFFLSSSLKAGPTGAKAIFDSGEGPSKVSSITQKPTSTEPIVAKEKYVGIAYQIMLLSPDGSFRPVSKARTFKSGERVKLIVRTNRSGYLTIMNIGPTGNTNILFDEYVEAFTFAEIPKNTNLVFAGPAGTEKLLIMLSDSPNPMTNKQQTIVESTTPSTSPDGGQLVASLESAKSIKGSKDIVAEDSMKSSYAIISAQNGYKPVKFGMKDIVLESSAGVNYGVIPVSTVANGGILTLQINLKHR